MGDEAIQLDEAAFIEQQIQALTRRELAALVLRLEPVVAVSTAPLGDTCQRAP